MAQGKENLLVAVSPAKFLISHADYNGKSKSEARREIKKLLDKYRISITPEMLAPNRFTYANGAKVQGRFITTGTTWVRAYYDNTDNTGKIEYGKPVAFDTVKGWGVTGINPKWSPDEYKVVGVSLADYEQTGEQGKVPVVLEDTPKVLEPVLAKAKVKEGDWPSIQSWSEATQGSNNQQVIWEFELPKEIKFKESDSSKWFEGAGDTKWEGSGAYVKAFNLTRQYVPKNVYTWLHPDKKTGQLYFDYYMPPSLLGTLDTQLTTGGSVLMTIHEHFRGEFEGEKVKVYDYLMNANKKLPQGAKVWTNLFRYSSTNTIDPFVWRLGIVQSNTCPISATS